MPDQANDKPEDLFGFLCWLNEYMGGFGTIEHHWRVGNKADEAEIRRWIVSGLIEVNGERIKDLNRQLEFPLKSLIVFPQNRRLRNTLI